jgi:N-acetylglucosamine-6-phosphate deacetylase
MVRDMTVLAPVALLNATAVLPDRLLNDATVICSGNGRIKAVGMASKVRIPKDAVRIDVQGRYLVPGYVDVHVHGGNNADYMDGTVDAVRTVNRAHARHGTTTIFPTTTTGSPEQLDAMLDACTDVRKNWQSGDGARIGGVHFYGPYFAESKVGCHSLSGRRDPSSSEYGRYFRRGIIKVATCAAELPGAVPFYRTAKRHRCLITCGHSNATWIEMERAFKAGMRHVDHFWCAMSSVASLRATHGTPMQASMEQFVLANAEMSTEVIADGCHLSNELLRFALQMKGPERLCLVTDCNRALDQPPGRYRFGNVNDGSWMDSDGKVGRAPNGSLASSVVGMDNMVRHMAKATRAPLPDTIRMATLTPAERVGMQSQIGSIEVGKQADLLILNRQLKVMRVLIAAKEYPAKRSRGKDTC